MKGFRICWNDDERKEHWENASDIVNVVKKHNLKTFDIYWKSPLYKNEWAKLISFENGQRVYLNENLDIPKTLLNIK